MTEAFVASRITLRAHVISLYTGATEQGRIHKVSGFPFRNENGFSCMRYDLGI